MQHLSEIHHYSACTCKHANVLNSLPLHIPGLCLMQLPLTSPDPDPHSQADIPGCPQVVPIPKEVPNAQNWGCPCLPQLHCSLVGGVGLGWCRSALSPQGRPHSSWPPFLRELLVHTRPLCALATTRVKMQLFGANHFTISVTT